MGKINKVEKMNDHDLLIRLDAKVDQLSLDIKSLGEGVSIRIAKIEQRLDIVDKILSETDPTALVKLFNEDHEWIKGFKITWKIILGLIGLIGIIIGVILGSFNIFDFLR